MIVITIICTVVFTQFVTHLAQDFRTKLLKKMMYKNAEAQTELRFVARADEESTTSSSSTINKELWIATISGERYHRSEEWSLAILRQN
jgi:hypothetical protein